MGKRHKHRKRDETEDIPKRDRRRKTEEDAKEVEEDPTAHAKASDAEPTAEKEKDGVCTEEKKGDKAKERTEDDKVASDAEEPTQKKKKKRKEKKSKNEDEGIKETQE